MLELPRGYLSYSAYALWKRDRGAFRQKYYYGAPSFETPETMYGRDIAKAFENNDPRVAHVPRYPISEHSIKIAYKGITLLGYIDSYDPARHAFLEYKTGHTRKDGSAPWSQLLVAKHEQLDFYSLLIELKEGSVARECELIWLETEKKYKSTDFEGISLQSSTYTLELTGRVERFARKIYAYDRKAIAQEIVRVAHDIATDYSILTMGTV